MAASPYEAEPSEFQCLYLRFRHVFYLAVPVPCIVAPAHMYVPVRVRVIVVVLTEIALVFAVKAQGTKPFIVVIAPKIYDEWIGEELAVSLTANF